jgi:hypothetical protein
MVVTAGAELAKKNAWPPLKKAIWDVIIAEELNGPTYVNAWALVDKLFTAALAVAPGVEVKPLETHVDGWTKVPEELSLELLRSINRDNQVLAYENGRYYNAWFEFEPSEGGWFWTDEADSEPNPSHYRPLREVALATTETNGHE